MTHPSSLSRLLETETRLEAVLSDARERAGTLRHEAESQARGRVAALDAELAEAAAQAERQHAADCAQRLAVLAREHELAMEALRAIAPARISELASWVSTQVLERAFSGGGS